MLTSTSLSKRPYPCLASIRTTTCTTLSISAKKLVQSNATRRLDSPSSKLCSIRVYLESVSGDECHKDMRQSPARGCSCRVASAAGDSLESWPSSCFTRIAGGNEGLNTVDSLPPLTWQKVHIYQTEGRGMIMSHPTGSAGYCWISSILPAGALRAINNLRYLERPKSIANRSNLVEVRAVGCLCWKCAKRPRKDRRKVERKGCDGWLPMINWIWAKVLAM